MRAKLTALTRRGMGETSIEVSRGRFDRSFVIRMIRDFLLALTVIIVAELGVRLALAVRDFQVDDQEATVLAAERLASDVRDIMLNSGGPVASRTVYPILRRTYADLGLEIAIEPSPVTVESIGHGVEGLAALDPTPEIDGVLDQARSIRARLEEAASGICSADAGLDDLGESLTELSKQLHDDAHYIGEILLLEERMQGIAETGQALLDRIEGVEVAPV